MQNCQIWFKHHATSEARTLFIVTCFEIWQNINEDIFQNMNKDTWAFVNIIILYHYSMVHMLGPTNKHHVTRQVRLNPLPEGYIRVNVDKSSFGNPAF